MNGRSFCILGSDITPPLKIQQGDEMHFVSNASIKNVSTFSVEISKVLMILDIFRGDKNFPPMFNVGAG